MRLSVTVALVALGLGACAQGGRQNPSDDDVGDDDDGPPIDARPPIDSIPVDAPPMMVTLSQNTATTIGNMNSFACANSNGETRDNNWYRIFRLADSNITGGLVVNSVAFGVQDSNGMPTVTVKIGTYSGNITTPPVLLDSSLITPIAMATYTVQNIAPTAPQMITVPVMANVPALSQLVAEVDAPDYLNMGKRFWIGGNASGESKPTWLSTQTAACNAPQPKNITAAGGFNAPNSQIVIQVNGTYSP